MCTTNSALEHLNKIRAKGHKLIWGKKVISDENISNHYKHRWAKGWNIAKNQYGHKMTRTKPYKQGEDVNSSFHIYYQSDDFHDDYELEYDERIITVWFYADEVTACEAWGDFYIVTCSRVLLKKLSKAKQY